MRTVTKAYRAKVAAKSGPVCSILNRRTVEPQVEERALVNRDLEPGWLQVARPTKHRGQCHHDEGVNEITRARHSRRTAVLFSGAADQENCGV